MGKLTPVMPEISLVAKISERNKSEMSEHNATNMISSMNYADSRGDTNMVLSPSRYDHSIKVFIAASYDEKVDANNMYISVRMVVSNQPTVSKVKRAAWRGNLKD